MYYINFEFIAKPQVDCIAAIAVSKIRIVWRDSMPVFQECADGVDGDAPGELMGDARGEESEGQEEVEERGEPYGVRKHEEASRWLFPVYCADSV